MSIKAANTPLPEGDGPSTVGLTTAAVRTVLAPLEDSGSRAELIARRLGDAIRMGLVLDGERLPAESDLAGQLGVSTVTLREALTILRAQGLVVTRRGRSGGSFVQAPADRGEPLRDFTIHQLRDLGDQRSAISGTAARLAAERALPEEIRQLEEQVERLRSAGTVSERRRANTELKIAIAAAAQSPRLTHEEARLRSEVGDLLALAADEDDHGDLVRGRERLVAAIADGDAGRARELAEKHVAAETERLIQMRLLLPGGSVDKVLDDVAVELEQVFAALSQLGEQYARVVAAADGRPRRDDLEALRPTIFALLAGHRGLVTGAGVIVTPEVLADAPRWLEWWYTGARDAPEALRVNLDPEAPDFYDYTTADWYATPEETGQPRMSGPYVDYACTNEYAITMAVPVRTPDGTMLGVAAADVTVASLEKLIVPELIARGRPAALTSADGRVIASNSAAVIPGQRLALDDDAVRRASSRLPAGSWLVVDL